MAALSPINKEVRNQLAVQTEIAAKANERMMTIVGEQSMELGEQREKLG
jgi:hypothetical protein